MRQLPQQQQWSRRFPRLHLQAVSTSGRENTQRAAKQRTFVSVQKETTHRQQQEVVQRALHRSTSARSISCRQLGRRN
jgi:hypothetical protein